MIFLGSPSSFRASMAKAAWPYQVIFIARQSLEEAGNYPRFL